MNTDRTLGIVIIGKNEGNIIRRVFTSVLNARDKYKAAFNITFEIIYIDSNSTDNSIEIAKELDIPFSIIVGRSSPSIARNLGLSRLNTRYIFFLDGDTEVHDTWLVKGVEYLEKNERIAGIGGILEFNIYKEGEIVWVNKNYWKNRYDGQSIYDGVGGTFLYRRDDVMSVGGFNECYNNSEEFDLMMRLLYNDKLIARLNSFMAIHHDYKSTELGYIKRYLLTKNIFNPGIVIRNLPKNGGVWKVIFFRYWLLILHLPVLIAILLLLSFGKIGTVFFLILLLFFFHFMNKDFNLKRTIISLVSSNFFSFGLYCGYFMKSKL